MSATPCLACEGFRLKPEALAVKIAGKHIGEVSELSVRAALDWFRALPGELDKKRNEIAFRILKEIRDRLTFLVDVGLDYLTLSRNSGTLSGGESQRIRLASQIGSGLTGVLYVLDEPSIGLHQRDNDRLLDTLRRLRNLGNSVIVVEHDEDAILAADYVVDVGPGAGIHGGKIVAQGTPQEIMDDPASLTGQYLTGEKQVILRHKLRKPTAGPLAQALRRARQQSQGGRRRKFRSAFSLRSLASRAAASRRSSSKRSTRRWRGGSPARMSTRRPSIASKDWSRSTRSSTSTNRRSAARRAPIPRPIPAPSRRSANGSRAFPKRRRAAMRRDASPSTSRADAAKPARATASSRSRCTFCRTSTSPATSARASATIARRSK